MQGYLPVLDAISWMMSRLFSSALMAQESMPSAPTDMINQTAQSLSIVVWIVVIAVGVLAIVFFALKIRNELAKGKAAGPAQDPASAAIDTALKSERKGDYIKAAMNYENLGDNARAAVMYEKGRDFIKAAELYEKLGKAEKAVAMYKRSGESLKAAGVYMRTRNFAEAAKIFKNKGDTLRAAQAFEMMGNKMAAAREYAASGQYMRAARMYKDERMFKEAGEVYAKELGDAPVNPINMGKYYTYAAFLVMAEDLEGAEKVYKSIADVDASFRDVQEKIRLIELRTGEVQEPELAIDKAAGPAVAAPEKPVKPEKKEPTAKAAPRAGAPRPAAHAPEPPRAKPVSQPVADAPSAKQADEPAPEDTAAYEDAIEGLFAPREGQKRPAAAESVAEKVTPKAAPQPAPPEVPPPPPPEAPPAAPPEEVPAPEAPPEAPPEEIPAPEAPPEEVPAEETMDQSVPSTRLESAPSRDASASELAQKVMGQSDIDDLFDEEGGGDAGEALSADDALKHETTLRSILNSGRMEPRYSMRMWMQILKQLYEKHSSGVYYGSIPPESIHIDMENNVRLEDPGRQQKEYTAPEVLSGAPPDEQTDIFAMGVILYEMVTGTVETIGEIYPIDAYDDIPEWMDEMIMRCLEKDRSVRYGGLDDISSLVLQRAAGG